MIDYNIFKKQMYVLIGNRSLDTRNLVQTECRTKRTECSKTIAAAARLVLLHSVCDQYLNPFRISKQTNTVIIIRIDCKVIAMRLHDFGFGICNNLGLALHIAF